MKSKLLVATILALGLAAGPALAETKAEILQGSGVHGKGISRAPGLQKSFNAKSKAALHAGKKR